MPTVTLNTHRLTLVGRDTCIGACETSAGCDCTAQPWPCEWECCTGNCTENSRECLRPAEACTDLGANDMPRPPLTSRDARTVLLLILAPWAVVIVAVWGALALSK